MQAHLTRKAAGLYAADICGERFTIVAREKRGGWSIYSQTDPFNYSDPIPTLRDCRLAIADMTARRVSAKVWGNLIALALMQFHRDTMIKFAATALVIRKVDLSNMFSVWDVIDEYGRQAGNTFYNARDFDYDGKNGDDLIADVLSTARAIIEKSAA